MLVEDRGVVRTDFLQFWVCMLKIGLVVQDVVDKDGIDRVDAFVRSIWKEWDLHLRWKKWMGPPGTKYLSPPTRTRQTSADLTTNNPKQ